MTGARIGGGGGGGGGGYVQAPPKPDRLERYVDVVLTVFLTLEVTFTLLAAAVTLVRWLTGGLR